MTPDRGNGRGAPYFAEEIDFDPWPTIELLFGRLRIAALHGVHPVVYALHAGPQSDL
jgi:hypothetical protein